MPCIATAYRIETAGPVLARLADVGLIDDAAFARAWVESRHRNRGLARRALSAELRQRGVDGQDIEAAVSALDPADEMATARRLVDKAIDEGQPGQTAASADPAAGRPAGPEGLPGPGGLPDRPRGY